MQVPEIAPIAPRMIDMSILLKIPRIAATDWSSNLLYAPSTNLIPSTFMIIARMYPPMAAPAMASVMSDLSTDTRNSTF